MKSIFKNIMALFFGLTISVLLLELFLRIWNPIPIRIQGKKIVLPRDVCYKIVNTNNPKLDDIICHTKNSNGFRGSEIPENLNEYLSIITIGGSTTECFYLSDDKTWPFLLEKKLKKSFKKIWLNNAGFDGHSTFGHTILMEDYVSKIKPKIILVLTGVNDIKRDDLSEFDRYHIKGESVSAQEKKGFVRRVLEKSALFNMIQNAKRGLNAHERELTHTYLDMGSAESLILSEEMVKNELLSHKFYADGYKERLKKLVDIIKKYGAEPILITQPMLFGNVTDSVTNVDLGTIKLGDNENGNLRWDVLELYNEKMREIGMETNTFVIDLAHLMPKGYDFFYDGIHFTNKGAKEVADILYIELFKHLRYNDRYASFNRTI